MKIKMPKSNNKNFYDELIYVNRNLIKITKNPRRKVTKETSMLKKYIVLCLILILFVLFSTSNSLIKYIVIGIWSLYLILLSLAEISIKNKINKIINLTDDNKDILEINDKFIQLKSNQMNTKIEIKDLKNIVYNKYTIIFLNKSPKEPSLIVSKDYQKEIEEALSKYNLDELIIE